ncbi:MAG: hypothetical protein QOE84_1845 [Actinomycetota bacterium]|jgi:hypothetical protein|nr:hypothetical protein [Actinomycetota bacterium]
MTVRRLLVSLLLVPWLAACGTSDPSTVAEPPASTAASTSATAAAGSGPTAVASAVASDTAQQTISFTVANKKVTGDTGRVKVKLGTRLRITVLSDTAEEIHVHVYDLMQEIGANSPGSIEFVADKPGVIEVELEHQKILLTHLQVQ